MSNIIGVVLVNFLTNDSNAVNAIEIPFGYYLILCINYLRYKLASYKTSHQMITNYVPMVCFVVTEVAKTACFPFSNIHHAFYFMFCKVDN